MPTLLERNIEDKLAGAIHRLASLEQTLENGETQPGSQKVRSELHRIRNEIERIAVETSDAAALREQQRINGEAASRRAQLLFLLTSTPCLVLDRVGTILEANPAAATIVNTSLRHLAGRPFDRFIAADRQRFVQQVSVLEVGDTSVRWPLTIRPRERAARAVTLRVVAEDRDQLLAVLLPPDTATDHQLATEDRELTPAVTT